MPASELQKKAIFLVVFVVSALLVLSALPFIESWLQASVFPRFGLRFQIDQPWQLTNESAVADAMNSTYANAVDTFFRILKIALWMSIVIALVRFVAYLVLRATYRNSAQSEVSSILKTVTSIIVYIIAFFIIFQSQYPGVSLTPLFTGSTILGIVVGLALQDTLGNLFAGLALQADQSFQVGDVISIANRGHGMVESVSWRGVKIRTFQNKLLVISNAALGKESIEVAPRENLNARVVNFSTTYAASPANTANLVREAMRQTDNVSQKIRPVVRIRDLAADGLSWEIKYWLEDYSKYNDTDAAIRQRVWYLFQRERIQFSHPETTIHIQPKQEEIALEDLVNTITERLNRVSIFAPLSEDEIRQLANASTSRVYAPGEAIVRKGQEGKSMFVIIRGSVKVQIPEKTYQKTLRNLGENDFFGEMCLLTGEPRSATVIAVDETEVLHIKKSGLKPIFESNPALVESICELIEERKELLKTTEGLENEGTTETRQGVMRSIKNFFGLK